MSNIRGRRMTGIITIATIIVVTVGALVWKFQNGLDFSETKNVPASVLPEKVLNQGETKRMGNIPDVSGDWKTYTNQDLGFELQYPALWLVAEDGFSDSSDSENGKMYGVLFSEKSLEEGVLPDGTSDALVGFQVYPSRKALSDFSCSPREEGKTCFSKMMTLSSVPMLVRTFERAEGEGMRSKEREIYIVRDGNVFQFYSGFNGIPQGDSLSALAEKRFTIDEMATLIQFLK